MSIRYSLHAYLVLGYAHAVRAISSEIILLINNVLLYHCRYIAYHFNTVLPRETAVDVFGLM